MTDIQILYSLAAEGINASNIDLLKDYYMQLSNEHSELRDTIYKEIENRCSRAQFIKWLSDIND